MGDDSVESNAAGSGRQYENDRILDASEVRVLAVLAEKEAYTPDSYPLSLNALTNGCNQLSSRDPVMSMPEDSVLDTLHRLVERKLVAEVRQAGARVAKYEHRMRIAWLLEQDKLAILAVLMLRGPQTAGEIRMRSGRLHDFASVGDVENGLQFLIDKYPPLVARLPRAPGMKETRYAHLLSGSELAADGIEADSGAPRRGRAPHSEDRIAQLEDEVTRLRAQIESLAENFENFRKQLE